MAELKGKVVRGFAWSAAEKIASGLFSVWVVINVLNRLEPEDTAVVAILSVLVLIFNSFVDSGFSQALIRKNSPVAIDFSSVFWFNVGVSFVVYALLVGLSYPMAWWQNMPDLVLLAPLFFLVVPLGALGIVQLTVFTRELDFRRLSLITFFSTIGGGLVAAGMVFAGFGVWSLVGQRLAQTVIKSLLLWIFSRWRPQMKFSIAPIREMFGYSSRLLATDLLSNLFNSIPQIIIGSIHRGTLGIYDTARKVRDLPLSSTMNAMQSITFPALARVSDDDAKFTHSVGRVVGSIVFLIFPMMAGLIVVAGEVFGLFLAPQWQGSVPFFRILCLAGFAMPLTVISTNILRSRTDGGAVFRAEVWKKVFAAAILAATIPFGAVPIAWGVVGIAFTDAAVSFSVARNHSLYRFAALGRDVLPVLALTFVMAGAVWGVGVLLTPFVATLAPKIALVVVLASKILFGVGIYFAGAVLLRLDALKEFMEVLQRIVGKVRSV